MLSDFLISFHKKHFAGTDIPLYSLPVLHKLLEEINKLKGSEENGKQQD